VRLIVAARALRGFADGFVSVLLAGYLSGLGFSPLQIGAVVTGTLIGSAVLTLGVGLAGHGRPLRTLLLAASALMAATGLGFAAATAFGVVLVVAVIGTLNPSAGDVSVFLPTEQAHLADHVAGAHRPRVYARYNLAGSVAGAVGALASGLPERLAEATGWQVTTAQRLGFVLYAAIAGVVALLYRRLPAGPAAAPAPPSARAEAAASAPAAAPAAAPAPASGSFAPASDAAPSADAESAPRRRPALGRSRRTVLELAALFSLDAAAGGLVVQSLLVLWLHLRFDLSTATTGAVFFAASLLSGASQLFAGPLAARIGLVRTMVFTHLPANVLLALAAFAPGPSLAVALLLGRALLSQMDVPARQSFVMAVVPPDERAAAASVTNVPRSLAAATTPLLAGALLARSSTGWPLLLAGVGKITYDLLLLALFRDVPEQEGAARPRSTRT
jgi:MFS family permease